MEDDANIERGEIEDGPPKTSVKTKKQPPKGWKPPLSKRQEEVFNSTARYILVHGERYSGKTFTAGHKIVRHCYENKNALALVVVGVKRQGTDGGLWFKLLTKILPMWKENLDGFDHTDQKMNTAKDVFIWVSNRHGGWSMIQLLSIPEGSRLAARCKGIEASMVFVDELVDIGGPEYFEALIGQLGRRPGTPKHLQQYIAATNPDGPSHWVYQRFFQMPLADDGSWDSRYAVFHVPFSENPDPEAQKYLENVIEGTRNDPIKRDRMLNGKWVDRPSGDAIFHDQFVEEIHVRPSAKQNLKGHGIMPLPEYPITIGYDPGPAHFSIHFLQMIPRGDQSLWVAIDELNHVGKRDPYQKVVFGLMDRMRFWNKRMKRSLIYEHIADEAAFSHRNNRGSFDARDIEELSKTYIQRNPGCGLQPIRLRPAPKGPDSIPERVRRVQGLLMDGMLLISATCPKTIQMFNSLERDDKTKDGPADPNYGFMPKRKSVHKHVFDSLSYPIIYHGVRPNRRGPNIESVGSMVFSAGR